MNVIIATSYSFSQLQYGVLNGILKPLQIRDFGDLMQSDCGISYNRPKYTVTVELFKSAILTDFPYHP
jgi:hypothetical protein